MVCFIGVRWFFIVRGGARATHLNRICMYVLSFSKVVTVCFFSIWMCNYVFLCNGDGAADTHTHAQKDTQSKRSRHLHLVHLD